MIEIGAGGGSLAHVDAMGLLKVGPRSAGSQPGPICYGQGGEEPAVTDADLLLGYLDPDYFLGGELSLDTGRVKTTTQANLCNQLGTDLNRTVAGIHDVVNENMAAAMRQYLAEKGRDPRRYSMIAFGGAGPVHAYGLARKLKIGRVIVPLGAGVTSALGFLVAPPAVDEVRSYVARLDLLDIQVVNALFDDMEAQARAQLTEAGANGEEITFTRSADMRYVGQGFEIPVPVPGGRFEEGAQASLADAYLDCYAEVFDRRVEDVAIEVLNWRVEAQAPAPQLRVDFASTAQDSSYPKKGGRDITITGFGTVCADVYDRYALTPGYELNGPAIIEERESTTVVGPDASVRVDEHRNLVIELHS
ncbi:MAG: hydantoinase/oxoprolinase family protein, partial [Chromatiales bacterium]|nr:hydantoinase/oxoprolinase family protein [Chromatiales bacterium]